MLETYQAILRENRVEWTGDAPRLPRPDQGVRVHVTLIERVGPASDQGQRMAAALERLAALSAGTIADPVAWERETRQDRPLPGRDEERPCSIRS